MANVDPKIRANVVAWTKYFYDRYFRDKSARAMGRFMNDFSHSVVSDVLGGNPRSIGLEFVVALADAFHVKVDEILRMPPPQVGKPWIDDQGIRRRIEQRETK